MAADNPTRFVEHIVLFKAKPEVEPDRVDAMVQNLQNLASIETVLHFTAGPIRNFRPSSSLTFTHMIYSRYATKEDLDGFAVHPVHLGVIGQTKPLLDDVMAVDWWHSSDSITIPSGSVLRVSFLKLKDNLEETEKNQLLGIIEGLKDKFPSIQELSVGENFSPARCKGFSIASVAVFKDAGELEKFDSEWEAVASEQRDLMKEKVEDAIVFDYVKP
ncbi:OLC1v1037852C1 [Oldenlandia corymbosa var. corymbosa]|uniref:OLC1v1037852C1 n=1 Tax=Oldenlandia corymbosa var. corymbosa TaxID=529605 RepID=A0AAV1CZC3_OLDCO|nr:OLC1v1037852C1 [Oldenlandia corymbosa var. corymbosa]